jgi:hypothetical protein
MLSLSIYVVRMSGSLGCAAEGCMLIELDESHYLVERRAQKTVAMVSGCC